MEEELLPDLEEEECLEEEEDLEEEGLPDLEEWCLPEEEEDWEEAEEEGETGMRGSWLGLGAM